MRKIIENYSILILPILVGIAAILLYGGKEVSLEFSSLFLIASGIMSVLIILPPMLRLSSGKHWYVRFLYGVISSILVYFVTFLLMCVAMDITDSVKGHESDIINYFIKNEIIKIIYAFCGFVLSSGIIALTCLILFLPFSISVILCFLVNDIYADKIHKVICHIKSAKD